MFMFFIFAALWPSIFMITTFGKVKLGTTDQLSTYLLMITNGTNLVGRVLAAALAEKFGMAETLFVYVLGYAITLFEWLGIKSIPAFDMWVVLCGLFSGVLPYLGPALVTYLCPNLDVVGTRTGMVLSISALGVLVGNPVSHAINDLATKTFWKSQLFFAISIMASSVLLLYPMLHLRRKRLSS
jgi:MFS family permease